MQKGLKKKLELEQEKDYPTQSGQVLKHFFYILHSKKNRLQKMI